VLLAVPDAKMCALSMQSAIRQGIIWKNYQKEKILQQDAPVEGNRMKIAIASDDKKTISSHFGRASGFVVFDIKNGKAINRNYRENVGKSSGECGSCDHQSMINNIKDCDVVISYGMGQKIYDDLIKNKIKPIVTEVENVDEALNQFLKKNLKNATEKLH